MNNQIMAQDIEITKVTIKRCALVHKAALNSPIKFIIKLSGCSPKEGGVTEIRELKSIGEEISATPNLGCLYHCRNKLFISQQSYYLPAPYF